MKTHNTKTKMQSLPEGNTRDNFAASTAWRESASSSISVFVNGASATLYNILVHCLSHSYQSRLADQGSVAQACNN
jgi:hypothetical protein